MVIAPEQSIQLTTNNTVETAIKVREEDRKVHKYLQTVYERTVVRHA